jgi:hypothetical protein
MDRNRGPTPDDRKAERGDDGLASFGQGWVAPALFALVVVALVLGFLLQVLRTPETSGTGIGTTAFGLVALAMLITLLPRLGRLESFVFSPTSLEVKLRDVQETAVEADRKADLALEELQTFVLMAMPVDRYRILRDVVRGTIALERVTEPVKGELRHLRDNGYITVHGTISDIPENCADLQERLAPTAVGRDFVALRERHVPEILPTGSRAVGR